jgi:hypothetical protein
MGLGAGCSVMGRMEAVSIGITVFQFSTSVVLQVLVFSENLKLVSP